MDLRLAGILKMAVNPGFRLFERERTRVLECSESFRRNHRIGPALIGNCFPGDISYRDIVLARLAARSPGYDRVTFVKQRNKPPPVFRKLTYNTCK